MKKIISIVIIIFVFISCEQKEITENMLIGKYVCEARSNEPQWRGLKNILELKDSTYFHQIFKDNQLILEEKGQWEYTNHALSVLYLYNYTVLLEYVTDTIKFKHRFGLEIKRTYFGNIVFEAHISHDPDGAPMRPQFKRIDKQ
jgi:hypothetical protein